MKSSVQVSVCGCGWLGLPLAKSLQRAGFSVMGSKQSREGAGQLREIGIPAVVLQLPLQAQADAELSSFLAAEVLLINVPPGRRQMNAADFVEAIMSLSRAAKRSGCQRVIFISTTSVYGEIEGEVLETTIPEPTTESGKAHLYIEQQLRQVWGDALVVLRLAGLIGPGRHPVKFLAGREAISNGDAPVNLVHLDDVIAAVQKILVKWPAKTTLHLSAPQHPSRAQYYREMARMAELPLPEFQAGGETGKWINAEQTAQALGLRWLHTDLLSEPPEC
ncbi:NAD-dependent epimerase/dehydratase family protein [Photobacterium sp. GJ3]|uniref:NAD-dependent epimerase/dehydratase family protein n=1 Tax=Photobacterium sp. GJ3 TaxID=2829502 RepID=UPI0020120D9D|nr:NAD-dependent epimerase/dehydratase family protein [Photobacterium sp. GJ3]